ncbi:MAG: Carboxylesterase 2 [Legionellaceae bacterium]
MNTTLSYIEINPENPPKATVIWLHGLGADGNNFANIVPELHLPKDLPIRFIFPHAPIRPITVNNGSLMRGWYDITGFTLSSREDKAGLDLSQQAIIDLIKKENERGIETSKIILAGFSQGGALALYTGLRYEEPFAGIIALSSYLPLANNLAHEMHISNTKTSIFLVHGIHDTVIPLEWAEIAKHKLMDIGNSIEWHTYPIDHSVSFEEIQDIRRWLIQQLT